MKRQFTSILLFSALLMGGASTFVSCTDHESDSAYNTSISFADAIEQQKQDLINVNNYLTQVKKYINEDGTPNIELINAIQKQIETNQAIIDKIKDYAHEEILGDATDLNEAIKKTKAYTDITKDLYGENGNAGMKKALENLEAIINGADGKDGLSTKTEEIWSWYQKEKVKKYLESKDTVNLSYRTDTLSQRLYTEIANAQQWVKDQGYLTSADLNGKITLDDVKTWYNNTGINERLAGISDSLKNISNSIDDMLTKQVSGIIVQASESPITGYENTPFGVQVGILGAYYGNAEEGFKDFNGKIIAPNKNFVANEADNAGTIYVTVNPANVNPQAITLRLVDSQGKAIASTEAEDETPFVLEWANTDKVLKYGVSRSANTSSNGFYAVKMKLNPAGVNDTKIWNSADKSNLKAAGKNILDKLRHPKSSRLNVGDIVSTINSTFNNRLTAYGLEASWIQHDQNGKVVENKKVTSKLDLAAIALNPLSFEFLSDGINVDLPTIPTLQSKIDFSSYKFNWTPIAGMGDVKTSITLEGIPDIDNIKINGTVLPPTIEVGKVTLVGGEKVTAKDNGDGTFSIDLSQVHGEADVTVGDIKIDPSKLQITVGKTTGTYDVTIPMDEFNKIIDNINGQVGNMIENVNGIVDKINGYSESIDGQLINRINSYIKRFENALTKANSLLQPAMFYTTSNGSWNQLARIKEGASYLKLNGGQASTVFIASSYTAELLAPAYQKQLTVDGGATLTVAGKTGSTVTLEGNKYKVGFKATKPGVYTITYKAIDYSGHDVSKPFFVKVVE